ncbi:MAG TPA: hypothetical protein VIE44_09065 [Methylomirabilota bacterium]|jgi:hypothetical protein
MGRTRILTSLALAPLLLLCAACGKGGGGGGSSATATDPTIPVISNLRVTLGPACTAGGMTGTRKTLVFDFTDADGNLRGGTVTFRATFDLGGPSTLTGTIPSGSVAITGTTSGSLAVTSCLRFGSNASFTQEVVVTDASGKTSNVLSQVVPNPGGIPLQPREPSAAPGQGLDSVD